MLHALIHLLTMQVAFGELENTGPMGEVVNEAG